jgi:thiamine pyrophosphokinase
VAGLGCVDRARHRRGWRGAAGRSARVRIDRWVGDGDSLGEDELARLAASGVPVERANADKDESDTELAVRTALREGADGIVIVGVSVAGASTMRSRTSASSRCPSSRIAARSSSTADRG